MTLVDARRDGRDGGQSGQSSMCLTENATDCIWKCEIAIIRLHSCISKAGS